MKKVTIRQLRGSASEKMLTEMFEVTSHGRRIGTWYPGDEGLVLSLLKVVISLNKASNLIKDIPFGIKHEELVENPLDEKVCEKCGGSEEMDIEYVPETGEKHDVCKYCLGTKKRK